jgi:hypothetical protein
MRTLLLLPLFALAACSPSNKSASVDYDQLRGGMSAADVRHLPPDRPLECRVPTSGHGVSWCEVVVTELDGLKAARLTYYFEDDKLVSAKAEFGPTAFDEVAKMMDARYPRLEKGAPGTGVWKVANGAVISSATDLEHGNVYTYWLSAGEMAKAGL